MTFGARRTDDGNDNILKPIQDALIGVSFEDDALESMVRLESANRLFEHAERALV
jgi:hypothetical protein